MRPSLLASAFASVLAASLASSATATAQGSAPRLVVTPATPRMVAKDTLRLAASVVDENGKPIPGIRVRFFAGGSFEARVDSTGLVTSGAVGTFPVTVSAIVPGARPLTKRVDVVMVPGPAASVVVTPQPTRLLAGQRLQLSAIARSADGDSATDRVTWKSSAPGVVRVSESGLLTAVAAGRARVTAAAGSAERAMELAVISGAGASVTVTPSSTSARQGDVLRFAVQVKDAAGKTIEGLTPNWTFAPGRGEIGADGAFVGSEPGTYLVSANFGRVSGDASVSLTERNVRRKATVVGSVLRTAFVTSEVWVHPNGKVAYLGTHAGGDRFYVIDISNPAKPVIADSVMENFRVVNDIMTDEKGEVMVFTREGADNRKNGIVVATLEDPLHPKKVADFTDGVTSGVHSAFIYTDPKHGRHAYITNDATGAVHVINIDDPTKPRQVSSWKTPRPGNSDAGRSLHDVDVQDGLLYGSWWNDGLIILDVGNGMRGGTPSNPVLVSQYKYDLDAIYRSRVETEAGAGYIRGTHTAWRHKNYVFIADEVFDPVEVQAALGGRVGRAYGRLQVIDVTDISKPKSVASYEPEFGGVHNVWVAGDTLYMGAYNSGFHAFDVSGELRGNLQDQGREITHFQPQSPGGKIPNATMTWGVVVKNNLAFINDMNSGLWIVRLEPKPSVVP
ncbi:MAG: Ig-like domain-containing protein [Gemmatimonadetes bacterium]|nr:Ig-like domain-containing protein [Gemmatimonadota bacterium]